MFTSLESRKLKKQSINSWTVEEKKIEIKRTPLELSGFKFAKVDGKQDSYNSIAGVTGNLPNIEENIKNKNYKLKMKNRENWRNKRGNINWGQGQICQRKSRAMGYQK